MVIQLTGSGYPILGSGICVMNIKGHGNRRESKIEIVWYRRNPLMEHSKQELLWNLKYLRKSESSLHDPLDLLVEGWHTPVGTPRYHYTSYRDVVAIHRVCNVRLVSPVSRFCSRWHFGRILHLFCVSVWIKLCFTALFISAFKGSVLVTMCLTRLTKTSNLATRLYGSIDGGRLWQRYTAKLVERAPEFWRKLQGAL